MKTGSATASNPLSNLATSRSERPDTPSPERQSIPPSDGALRSNAKPGKPAKARTTAQRQAAYRARRPFAGNDGNGERRLNLWLSTGAFVRLARLARHDGVSKREVLELLINAADALILTDMDMDTPEWDAYMGIHSVTQ